MQQTGKAEAQAALAQREASAFLLLKSHTAGLRTGEVAQLLGIESHCPTPNSNWLARCVLENLVAKKRAASEKRGGARVFRAL
jgi:hypothetical protein